MINPLKNDHLTEAESRIVSYIIEELNIKSFAPRTDPDGKIRMFDYDNWCWMPTREALEKIYEKSRKLNFGSGELLSEDREVYEQLMEKYSVSWKDGEKGEERHEQN